MSATSLRAFCPWTRPHCPGCRTTYAMLASAAAPAGATTATVNWPPHLMHLRVPTRVGQHAAPPSSPRQVKAALEAVKVWSCVWNDRRSHGRQRKADVHSHVRGARVAGAVHRRVRAGRDADALGAVGRGQRELVLQERVPSVPELRTVLELLGRQQLSVNGLEPSLQRDRLQPYTQPEWFSMRLPEWLQESPPGTTTHRRRRSTPENTPQCPLSLLKSRRVRKRATHIETHSTLRMIYLVFHPLLQVETLVPQPAVR